MNSNRILNLPAPISPTEPVRLQEIDDLVGDGTLSLNAIPTGGTDGQVLTKASAADFDADWETPIALATSSTSGVSTVTPVLADQVVIGDVSDSENIKKATIGAIATAMTGNVVPCIVTGTISAMVFTPVSGTITTLLDGMMFSGVPNATASLVIPTLQVTGTPAKGLRLADGYGFPIWSEVQKNKPLTVRYHAALDVFTIVGAMQHSFAGSAFSHGTGKLQSNGSNNLFYTQEDGRGMMIWNPLSGSFRLINIPVVSALNLFAGQNFVEGVANQALASNQLYSVYLWNPTGTNDQDIQFDFYRTNIGAAAAWNPTINEIGMYVKPTIAGGTLPDNTRTYVGVLYTFGNDVTTTLAGPIIQTAVHSHHKIWQFPYTSDVVTVSGITTASNVLTSPRVVTVSEGINLCPRFGLHANYSNTVASQLGTISLQIVTRAFNGSTSTSIISQTAKATSTGVGTMIPMFVETGFANSMSEIEVRPVVGVAGGSGTFEMYMTGVVTN